MPSNRSPYATLASNKVKEFGMGIMAVRNSTLYDFIPTWLQMLDVLG